MINTNAQKSKILLCFILMALVFSSLSGCGSDASQKPEASKTNDSSTATIIFGDASFDNEESASDNNSASSNESEETNESTDASHEDASLPDDTDTSQGKQEDESEVIGDTSNNDTSGADEPDMGTDTSGTDVELKSLSIRTFPDVTDYFVGESLDPTGLTLKAVYVDGSTRIVTDGFNFENATFNSAGKATVTVFYEDMETSFDVSVVEATVLSISVKTLPNKTDYYVGESLNTAGLTIEARYTNGTTKIISGGFTCSNTTYTSAGKTTVTVEYEVKTATFTVNVTKLTETYITIRTMPTTTVYNVGDLLDTSGLTLNLHYSNGTSTAVTSGFSCSPTRFTEVNSNLRVAVTYHGLTAYFSVTVNKAVSKENIVLNSSYTLTYSYNIGNNIDNGSLLTNGEYRGDGTNYWNEASGVPGVTVEFAGTSSENSIEFAFDEAKDISTIVFKNVRIASNRNFNLINIEYTERSGILVNASWSTTQTEVYDAPSYGVDDPVPQYYDITVHVKYYLEDVIRLKLTWGNGGQYISHFDEVEVYA